VQLASGVAQAVPSFGTVAGQPAPVGGGAQYHAGWLLQPPGQLVQRQRSLPKVQTRLSTVHVAPEGSLAGQAPGAGSRQTFLVVVHVPPRHVQSLRHSGRTDSP
jgi:hypothetical protein